MMLDDMRDTNLANDQDDEDHDYDDDDDDVVDDDEEEEEEEEDEDDDVETQVLNSYVEVVRTLCVRFRYSYTMRPRRHPNTQLIYT